MSVITPALVPPIRPWIKNRYFYVLNDEGSADPLVWAQQLVDGTVTKMSDEVAEQFTFQNVLTDAEKLDFLEWVLRQTQWRGKDSWSLTDLQELYYHAKLLETLDRFSGKDNGSLP